MAPTAEDLCVRISTACLPGFDLPICPLAYSWAEKMISWSTTRRWILRLLFHLSDYVIPFQQSFILFIRGFKPDSQGALLRLAWGLMLLLYIMYLWWKWSSECYGWNMSDFRPGGLQSKSTSSPDSQYFFCSLSVPGGCGWYPRALHVLQHGIKRAGPAEQIFANWRAPEAALFTTLVIVRCCRARGLISI